MPPQTPAPATLLNRPFLVDEARRAGISAEMLRGSRFRRIFRSVYVASEVPDCLTTRVDAVRLVVPAGAVFSHHTAAQLRGLPVPPTDLIHVTIQPGVRGARRTGVCTHQGSTPAMVRDGRRLSAPAENFVELAETLSLVDLVILGDAMVRRELVTCADLVAATASTRRRRGVRLARAAAVMVRPRVDSPMETRVRLLIVLAGLPEPAPGHTVRDAIGGWIGEVDLAYPADRIAIEYHGDVHRSSPGKWRRDIAKAELLAQLGWIVIVLTSEDMFARPERTLRRIRGALAKAGHPGLPTEPDPTWREHFVSSRAHAA